MKAKDVMHPISNYLSPENTLQQAVKKMRAEKGEDGLGVRGMVVLNGPGDIVGILSIKDVLRATIPFYLDPGLSRVSWDGMLEHVAECVVCKKVSEFMATDIVTVAEDAPLMACADLMIRKSLQRLPVVDSGGKVKGMVTIGDVYSVVSQIFTDQPECEK